MAVDCSTARWDSSAILPGEDARCEAQSNQASATDRGETDPEIRASSACARASSWACWSSGVSEAMHTSCKNMFYLYTLFYVGCFDMVPGYMLQRPKKNRRCKRAGLSSFSVSEVAQVARSFSAWPVSR